MPRLNGLIQLSVGEEWWVFTSPLCNTVNIPHSANHKYLHVFNVVFNNYSTRARWIWDDR